MLCISCERLKSDLFESEAKLLLATGRDPKNLSVTGRRNDSVLAGARMDISLSFTVWNLPRRCRAWSAPKKVWCCKEKGKGCQSPDTPPACDAGAGKVWKTLGPFVLRSYMRRLASSVPP